MLSTENNMNDSAVDVSAEQELNLGEIIHKYLYHWPVFVLGLLIFLFGAFFYLRYTRPIYQVTSTLLIKSSQKSTLSSDILNQLEQGGGSKEVDNEIEILKSRTLMTKVVERLNLNVKYKKEGRVISIDAYDTRAVNFFPISVNKEYYNVDFLLSFPNTETYILKNVLNGKSVSGKINEIHKTIFGVYKIERLGKSNLADEGPTIIRISDIRSVVNECLSGLTVEVKSKQSTVLQLGYQTPVIKQGEDILNTLVQVYNEASLLDKNKTTQRTLQFIDERIAPLSGELTDVEKDVENYKSSQGLTNISSQAELYLEGVKSNDAQISEVNIKLAVISDVQRFINSNLSGEKLPTTMGIDDPSLLNQINQLSELFLERDKLLTTTQAANPIMQPIYKQIETIRGSIQASVENIKANLLNTKKQIEINNSGFLGSIKKIPGQERQFMSIKRQQTIKEALYLYLLQKKEETALSYASSVADTRLIDPAIGFPSPIKPNKQMVYLAALFIGLILPGIYVFSKDILNNKIQSKSDISKITNAPLLGELVYEEGTNPIVVSADSRKAIAEQFRSIRTNLQFVHGKQVEGLGRVTLFTSSVSGEGKSFVASNLGAALAISGRKTILLELDLRKPKITKYLKLTVRTGLSNYLIGKAGLEEIIQDSGVHANLKVIGSGPIPPNPSELLIQQEMDDLVSYLRKHFDEIVIDAPPIGLVTDAQILARLADSTIYIVRHGVTLKSNVNQFNVLYKQNKFPKFNLVFNGVQLGGSYGYGYGYGYGYYSDDVKESKLSLKAMLKDFFKRF